MSSDELPGRVDHPGPFAGSQSGFEHQLRGFLVQIVQSSRVDPGELPGGQIGQRIPGPQRQGLAEHDPGLIDLVTSVGQPPALGHQFSEADGINLIGGDPQDPAGPPGLDHRTGRGQHTTQPRDVGPQHDRGPGRWFVGPDLVDQPVRRHDPVGVQGQQREDGSLLDAAQHQLDLAVADRDRPEQTHPHASILTARRTWRPRGYRPPSGSRPMKASRRVCTSASSGTGTAGPY